jgi:hypothetical protein
VNIFSSFFPQAKYEGVTIELINVNLDYAVNEIPTATVSAAVGFNARSPNVVSAVHWIADYLKLFVAASIWVKVKPTYRSGDLFYNYRFPSEPFRVFDGWIIGSACNRTDRGAEYNLQLSHWLSNLNFSSCLSRSSSPQNPGQTSFEPSLPDITSTGGVSPGGNRHASYITKLLPELVNTPVVFNDLWGNTSNTAATPPVVKGLDTSLFTGGTQGIKGWFTRLCLEDRINWNQFATALCGGEVPTPQLTKNVEALAALRRIEPLTVGYIDGVPLGLKASLGSSNIAAQISTALSMQFPDSLANSTLWDKLVGEFGSELLFAVVPQVEKALVVPFNPGLRTYWTTVYANEFTSFRHQQHIPRPLRGVGLFIGKEFASGGSMSLERAPVYNNIGAYYENPSRRNGMVVFKRAPRWLSTVLLPYRNQTAGKVLLGSAYFSSSADPKLKEKAPAKKFEEASTIWCQYARALYIQEVLRGRIAELSGRLRFDIAPGSMIRLEVPEDQFVLQRMGKNPSFGIAQVIRVSITINSEARQCGTAFQLSFYRDESENRDNSYSIDTHPIWKNNWVGAPLVNHPEFYLGTIKDPLAPG